MGLSKVTQQVLAELEMGPNLLSFQVLFFRKAPFFLSSFTLASNKGWELLPLPHAGSSGNVGVREKEEDRMGSPWPALGQPV